ncbi:ABC transporter ATP-binding protein [Phenylobacterium sp.]|uniref:ABC transporter ATP-binding protein n=1 Tax=Phenylobacterium sp. TaxID=1871053 RepID=UPI0025F0BF04|nr:ABC transporter ATP-binding protein [Phenylobacterium sp.]MBX3482470.1 ABC transporter ATP-binding protein [Phenylobacterium sp.]
MSVFLRFIGHLEAGAAMTTEVQGSRLDASTRKPAATAPASAAPPEAAEAQGAAPDYLASFRLMTPYLAGSRASLATAVVLASVAVACELFPVWAVYRIVEATIAGALDWPFVVAHAGGAAAAVLAGFSLMGAALGLSHLVAFDVIHRLRLAVARRMSQLPLGYFSERRSGEAKTLVIDEPERLELIIAHGLPEGVSAIATWIAVSVWLFALDWRMALAAVVMTPIAFALLILSMVRGAKHAAAYQAAGVRMNASIVEYLAGMPVVKVFNRAGESFAETSEAVRDYAAIETRWAKESLPLASTFYALVLANIVVILPVGLILLRTGTLSLPTLLLFVILGATYSQPLLRLFSQFHTLAHVSMGSMKVAELLAAEPQADTGRRVALEGRDIVFDKVAFAYGEHDVLHDVSFTARAGEVTALVGPSGSGKTTIAGLVARFRDVRQGRVTIGGMDVREIGLDQLMDTVAFVFQDTFLFSDTIAANIRFGAPAATDAEVEAAARAARAHEFISALPDGYATHLGEQGRSLSGGERQRLAIARAILKDAPIVVLDEATAFADPDNEAAIQDAIGALTAGRTLVVVAHRLHTVAAADQILVVDGGRIVERGRHDDLVATGGLYARLWRDYNQARAVSLRAAARPARRKAAAR